MISVKINNLKTFSSHLLVKDTFSSFLLVDAQIQIHSTFQISGRKNPSYFMEEEEDDSSPSEYNPWSLLRPICYEIIKGRQLPAYFKFVFRLDEENLHKLLLTLPDFSEKDVEGLYLNVKYENGILSLTTGTALKIFTLDKALDKAFDHFLTSFLENHSIDFSIC